jgi:hypothetical protein
MPEQPTGGISVTQLKESSRLGCSFLIFDAVANGQQSKGDADYQRADAQPRLVLGQWSCSHGDKNCPECPMCGVFHVILICRSCYSPLFNGWPH